MLSELRLRLRLRQRRAPFPGQVCGLASEVDEVDVDGECEPAPHGLAVDVHAELDPLAQGHVQVCTGEAGRCG